MLSAVWGRRVVDERSLLLSLACSRRRGGADESSCSDFFGLRSFSLLFLSLACRRCNRCDFRSLLLPPPVSSLVFSVVVLPLPVVGFVEDRTNHSAPSFLFSAHNLP